MLRKGLFLLLLFSATLSSNIRAQEKGHEKEDFDPVEMIMEHVKDAYSVHLWGEGDNAFSIPLPVILFDDGLKIFMSSEFEHGHKAVKKGGTYYHMYESNIYSSEEKYLKSDAEGEVVNGSVIQADFSITKTTLYMFLVAIFMLWLFISIANYYKKNGNAVPRGKTSFIEPVIIFVRDDIAKANIGEKKYKKYLPYLLTVFFFIWIANLFGLFPVLGSNITGNIAVTLVLAMITLLITNFSANKHYWGHIFWMPNVPVWIKIFMIPIELVGVFTKPFALMIRLFANITAGHIIILSLISIIFIFENVAIAGISLPMTLFIYIIEILVTALQAYIFTMLSALFIGGAVEEH